MRRMLDLAMVITPIVPDIHERHRNLITTMDKAYTLFQETSILSTQSRLRREVVAHQILLVILQIQAVRTPR